jgi:hypothetical protein
MEGKAAKDIEVEGQSTLVRVETSYEWGECVSYEWVFSSYSEQG